MAGFVLLELIMQTCREKLLFQTSQTIINTYLLVLKAVQQSLFLLKNLADLKRHTKQVVYLFI